MGFRSLLLVIVWLDLVTAAGASAETPEEKGLQLVTKSELAQSGFGGQLSDVELTLINTNGDKVTRRLQGKRLEVQDDGDRSVLTLTWPADVKGARLLTWAHKKGSDDQWLYLPSAKRVKRISARDKSGSFMGSEFTLEDLAVSEVDKYTYRYLREETVAGRKAWVIERFPVEKQSSYRKSVVWIDQEYLAISRTDFYDRKGKLLKTATMDRFKKLEKWWLPDQIEMNNVQTRKKSVFDFKSRKITKVSVDEFDPESLSE